jgi:hypothetical protein
MKKIILFFYLITLSLYAKDYTKNADVEQLINEISQKFKLEKSYLEGLFSNVNVQEKALRLFRPRKK